MELRPSRFKQAMLWLLPSWAEVAVYVFITGVTFVLSSLDFFKNLFFITGDFNPIRAGVASIDALLTHFVGEKIAGSLSLAIFWGMVGLMVNILWWLGSNFSTELSNDLVFSRYVHPKDTDPTSQLKQFVERTLVRAAIAIVAVLYFNFFVREGLPHVSANFSEIIKQWDNHKNIISSVKNILIEMFLLHMFVILTRLVLLKKQVFD